MARIQVMPLSLRRALGAGLEWTTFAVVVDQLSDDEREAVMDGVNFESFKAEIDAAAVLVYDGALDVAQPLQLTDEQQVELVEKLGLYLKGSSSPA